jgi:hypothetical protein
MQTLLGSIFAFQNVAKHQVIIHGASNNLGHFIRFELYERKMLGRARPLITRQSQLRNSAELREIFAHLVLVKSVWDATGKALVLQKSSL